MTEILLKKLSNIDFSLYGEVLHVSEGQRPDSAGEGWECWYPLGTVGTDRNMCFGIVKSQPMVPLLHYMERHQDRVEYLVALDRPIIQAVALSHLDYPNSPDASRTEAFIIYPGQLVMINRGIWHAAALALGSEVAQYLFILGKPGKENGNPDSGLTRFAEDKTIEIKIPDELR